MRRAGRIGLLGGTFDPVHFGHLDCAAAARRALDLDQLLFIPSHDPPHRQNDPLATPFHRFALISLAIDGIDGYRAHDEELARYGPSYTVETLRRLHAEGLEPWQLFFILGADAFAEIATWREYPAVLDTAHFAVVARPGVTLDGAFARVPELRSRARSPVAKAGPSGETGIFLVEARTREVSSTQVRARLAAGQPIHDLVPAAVARHILAHHLYGAVDELHGQDEGDSGRKHEPCG